MIRNSENGIESDIKGLKKSNITAKYNINSEVKEDSPDCANIDLNDYYLNIQTVPADKSSELVRYLQGGSNQFTIYAHIEMDFDEDQLSDEFPIRETGHAYGVNVRVASNLAYDTDTLPYTSMTKSYAPDNHYYYIEDIPSAILTYSMKNGDIDQYDEIGLNSKNQSTLGVNGRSASQAERTNMPINTEAFYNVQSLSDAKNAEILRLTFSLNKKVDSGNPITEVDYQSIENMQNYLDGKITFTSGNEVKTVEATGATVTVDLNATKCNISGGIYDIDITFNAKSGNGFTEYSNYKVNLKAELFKKTNGESNVENSVSEDYLVYTNAKINPNILADLIAQKK